VIYLSDKYRGEAFHQASEIIFEAAGATVRKLKMPPLAELLQRFEGFIP